jgi:hypothetical protein
MAYMLLPIVLYHNKASTEEKEASYCFKKKNENHANQNRK